jgi:hypothetical protein
MYVCVCMHVYMHVCMYVCMYEYYYKRVNVKFDLSLKSTVFIPRANVNISLSGQGVNT